MVTLAELQANVFPGESGGDYNALYGYANRPGGPFAGVNVTDMTVAQALQFTDPSGPYASYVRGQIGHTATPMGAYQAVGSTLRDAAQGLGLTGNEKMTPELQDRIGMWIYEKQGPGAWAGWGKGGNMAMNQQQPQMPQDPTTFGDRLKAGLRSGSVWDNLALAFNSMRLNPDQNIAQIVGSRAETRQAEATKNKTAAWLRSQGREDLATAIESGAISGKDAASLMYTPKQDTRTAMIQNYEYWLSQGKTPEEAAKMAQSGAGGINVNMPDESQGALNKKLAENEATSWGSIVTQGYKAAGSAQDLAMLEEVLQYAPQSPLSGRLAQMFPNLSSAGAAATAIIKRVAPTLRAEGSGSTSDIEYNGMLESLPSLANYPEANAAIIAMMRAKASVDTERAQVIMDFQNSGQTAEDAKTARTRLAELNSRSIISPELRATLTRLGGNEAAPSDTTPTLTTNPDGSISAPNGITIRRVN